MFLRMVSIGLIFISSVVSAKVSITENGNQKIYNFKIDEVNFTQYDDQYDMARLKIDSKYAAVLNHEGYPQIPVIRFYVEGAKDIKVVFPKTKGGVSHNLEREIYPAQPPLAKTAMSFRAFSRNDSFYNSTQLWPTMRYKLSDASSINGVRRTLVTIYPLRYRPGASSYQFDEQFKVMTTREFRPLDTKGQKDLFVFIVGSQFASSSSLERYIEFKKSQGFATQKLVIGSGFSKASEIRSKLKSLLSENLKYVMLVGSVGQVPSYISSRVSGYTDHYYRAIDTNDYENDINGPDIGVGRIIPRSEDDLENIVTKFMRYQNRDFDSKEWLGKASFIASDDYYFYDVAEGTHNSVIDDFFAPYGFMGSFPNNSMLGGDRLYAIEYSARGDDVLSRIEQGRFIINYSGHGMAEGWQGPEVSGDEVMELEENGAYPFVISNACFTGHFADRNSFGEIWMRKSAIMYWGSMDTTTWDEDDILEKAMYRGIFEHDNSRFADITQYALTEVWRYFGEKTHTKYYWETYVTFGDPSIELAL